jgi:hypothetical protein
LGHLGLADHKVDVRSTVGLSDHWVDLADHWVNLADLNDAGRAVLRQLSGRLAVLCPISTTHHLLLLNPMLLLLCPLQIDAAADITGCIVKQKLRLESTG